MLIVPFLPQQLTCIKIHFSCPSQVFHHISAVCLKWTTENYTLKLKLPGNIITKLIFIILGQIYSLQYMEIRKVQWCIFFQNLSFSGGFIG